MSKGALDLPPKVVDLASRFIQLAGRYFDAEVEGLDRVPAGGALLVGNHNANGVIADSFIFAEALLRHMRFEEPVLALVHEAVLKLPAVGAIARRIGAIPATHEAADRALAAGKKVLVYPGGGWEASRPSRERDRIDFKGRRGFVRLALRTKVPIVPVVAAGAHDGWYVLFRGHTIAKALKLDRRFRMDVFPIAIGLPAGLIIGPVTPHIPLPHKILIEVLDPIALDGDPEDADDVSRGYTVVTRAMQDALTRLAARIRR
jgi:1-acyl-sn-glycerol-3-phosphate acyltransferase